MRSILSRFALMFGKFVLTVALLQIYWKLAIKAQWLSTAFAYEDNWKNVALRTDRIYAAGWQSIGFGLTSTIAAILMIVVVLVAISHLRDDLRRALSMIKARRITFWGLCNGVVV